MNPPPSPPVTDVMAVGKLNTLFPLSVAISAAVSRVPMTTSGRSLQNDFPATRPSRLENLDGQRGSSNIY